MPTLAEFYQLKQDIINKLNMIEQHIINTQFKTYSEIEQNNIIRFRYNIVISYNITQIYDDEPYNKITFKECIKSDEIINITFNECFIIYNEIINISHMFKNVNSCKSNFNLISEDVITTYLLPKLDTKTKHTFKQVNNNLLDIVNSNITKKEEAEMEKYEIIKMEEHHVKIIDKMKSDIFDFEKNKFILKKIFRDLEPSKIKSAKKQIIDQIKAREAIIHKHYIVNRSRQEYIRDNLKVRHFHISEIGTALHKIGYLRSFTNKKFNELADVKRANIKHMGA